MKAIRIAILALAYGAATLALAEDPPAPPADGKGPPMMMDCSKASVPSRCEERQKARKAALEKCKGLAEAEHKKCMRDAWKEGPHPKGDDKGK